MEMFVVLKAEPFCPYQEFDGLFSSEDLAEAYVGREEDTSSIYTYRIRKVTVNANS